MGSVSRTTTIYGSGSTRIDLYMSVKETEVLDDGDRKLGVYLALKCYGFSETVYNISSAYVLIDGTQVGKRTSGSVKLSDGQTKYIIATDYIVSANADGTGSVSCRGYFNSYSTSSATLTLNSVPQTGTGYFTPNPAVINTGGTATAITLTVTPRNPNYYHYVTLSCGVLPYIAQAWAEDNSYTFTITNNQVLTKNTAAASGYAAAVINTYSIKQQDPDYLIGTETVRGTFIIDTSAIHPSITVDSVDPDNTPITGQIVAGYSGAKINLDGTAFGDIVTASLNKGAVSSTNWRYVITDALPASETDYTVTATINARDHRGGTDQEQTTFTVKGYKRPIAKLTARRVASNGSTTYDEAGTWVYVTWTPTITALGSNSVQSESVTYAGDISGTLTTNPSWVQLTESQGATFTYTVTDLVATGTSEVSIPVAIFPLDLFQSGASVGAAFGGTAVGDLVKSFLPFSALFPVNGQSGSTYTLPDDSGTLSFFSYNGTPTITIPSGTAAGWWAVVIKARASGDLTLSCGGSDQLYVHGQSGLLSSVTVPGSYSTALIFRTSATRLAVFMDIVGGGGGGGSTDWSDLTNVPLVTTISSASTDSQFPSAKCVYDQIGDIETLLQALR